MREPNWKTCTEEELWKYVATHLAKHGVETILVGGAVVSIYSKGAYRSGDLDFVVRGFMHKDLDLFMQEIGFDRKASRHFRHPKCKHLFVELMSGPPAIGEDYKIKPDVHEVDGKAIYIYSPTDCICDRLASYIHFKARECLDQAALVASQHSFSRKRIKDWCAREGMPEAFEHFEQALKSLS